MRSRFFNRKKSSFLTKIAVFLVIVLPFVQFSAIARQLFLSVEGDDFYIPHTKAQRSKSVDRSGEDEVENEALQLWNQYKREHSHQVLRNEFHQLQASLISTSNNSSTNETVPLNMNDRKFSVGYYSCPLQAGNRLHHFMNSLIWSIVTNRTFLFQYFDRTTCQRIFTQEGGGDWKICNSTNAEEECTVLRRAEFLPPFSKWKTSLRFQKMQLIPYWSTHEKMPNNKRWKDRYEKYAGLADSTEDLVVEFAQMLGQDAAILKSERKRNYLLTSMKAKERAKQLFQLGSDYLYGLILHDCFQFQPTLIESSTFDTGNSTASISRKVIDRAQTVPMTLNLAVKNLSSSLIILHSRHSKLDDDGSKIEKETKCIKALLEPMLQNRTSSSCTVVLLSDRPKTLELLLVHIAENYPSCTLEVANHSRGTSWRLEHGPFAGTGFYQDMAMVRDAVQTQTTSASDKPLNIGFIGSKHRSSSQLVREILVFHHHLYRKKTNQKAGLKIASCNL